jgi:hypothetical protein
MSERAISIVARKSAAAAILNGDDLSAGLLEFDPGMSLLQELAKAVTKGDEDGLNADVRAMLAEGARALKADLEEGTVGMVGVKQPAALPETMGTEGTARSAIVIQPEDVVMAAPAVVPMPKVEVSAAPAPVATAPAAPDRVQVQKLSFGDDSLIAQMQRRRQRRARRGDANEAAQGSLLDLLAGGSAGGSAEAQTLFGD